MNFRSSIAAACLLLAGCGSISVPASGVTATGQSFTGSATVKINGEGVFELVSIAGVKCGGAYNAMDKSPAMSITFSCSDGRTGTADVIRNPDGMSGSGSGVLSDGETITFRFGEPKRA